MAFFPFKYMAVFIALLVLPGCSTLQSFLEQSPGPNKPSALQQELEAIDGANDKALARNKMIRKMIERSDLACNQYIQAMLDDDEQRFVFKEKAKNGLDTKLNAAIALRQFDSVDAQNNLYPTVSIDQSGRAIHTVLAKTIGRTRALHRVQLKARMEGYISDYSVKQALMDVSVYHQNCSARAAAVELARLANMQMSDEKRQASIETLMQLRQKLISDGVNTRAVQQKIDALILDY